MNRLFYKVALALSCVLLMISCKKEIYTFESTLEQPTVAKSTSGSDDTKNYLYNEEFIYWESGDAIRMGDGSTGTLATLSSGFGTPTGFFVTNDEMTLNTNVVAVYPASAWVSNEKLSYPSTSVYRNSDSPVNRDFSFGKDAFPMVAQYQSDNSLGFHSVSGVLRFQLFSSIGAKTIQSISFTTDPSSPYKQIVDVFNIKGANTNTPYLEKTDDTKNSTTITGINQVIGTSKSNLFTFYLPLPAQSNGSGYNLTHYILLMDVTATDGTHFTKKLGVDIRRNAITMMQAIDINQWGSLSTGSTNVHLVGCGTQLRPFQIYDTSDMVKIRTAINTHGTINGQAITKDTYFKVVRTDIKLKDENWNAGIVDFKGHFYCSSNSAIDFGITNNSKTPIFTSISSEGHVDSVTVRGTYTTTSSMGVETFSPLCLTNNGTMSNCVNQCNIQGPSNLAGVCATNSGIMNGCRNEGDLNATDGKSVAGVCYSNSGTVRNSSCLTTANLMGSTVGGIVNANSGNVYNCYISLAKNNASGNWGCIVYNNSGNSATINNCYSSGTLVTSGYAGGICGINSGSITQCSNRMMLLQGNTYVGGIAAFMTGGTIINCYLDGTNEITTGSSVTDLGGFVGRMTGGALSNSYNTYFVTVGNALAGNHTGSAVGVVLNSKIDNCYATYNATFYGQKGSSVTLDHCYGRQTQNSGDITILKVQSGEVYLSAVGDLQTALQNFVISKGDSKYFNWQQNTTQHYPVLTSTKGKALMKSSGRAYIASNSRTPSRTVRHR